MDNNGQCGFHGHSSVGNTHSFQTDESSTTSSTGSESASIWGARVSVPSSSDSPPGFLGNNTGQETASTEVAARSILTVAASSAAEKNWLPGGIYGFCGDFGERRFKVLAVDDLGVHIKLFPAGTQQESLATGEAGRSKSRRPVHGCPGHSPDSMLVSHMPLLYSGINQLDTYLLGNEDILKEEMKGLKDWAIDPRAGYFDNMEQALDMLRSFVQSYQ